MTEETITPEEENKPLTEAQIRARQLAKDRMDAKWAKVHAKPGWKPVKTTIVHKSESGRGWTVSIISLEKNKVTNVETLDWRANREAAINKAEEILWNLTR